MNQNAPDFNASEIGMKCDAGAVDLVPPPWTLRGDAWLFLARTYIQGVPHGSGSGRIHDTRKVGRGHGSHS